ncbi:STAS domain-containing protein [Zooshikella marina]|uniref:Anti-sigma factor antagonist n=1 Tax=Zooshikella ganghwensis TaxID=202772 RepID=A0A4P9VQH5_9GAMM|nr:STAS domain-containing protein [Zooshikella ganghwensis]MBU2704353.1 STAS domain-containing protein [Zooshikella ganghwensis]RDH44817.1 anti-sigma factor antagonist [Zooshikella ganghwensis]
MTAGKIQFAENEGTYVLKFVGDVRLTLCSTLDTFLDKMFAQPDFKSVIVDLTETEGIDSTSLGLLAKLSIQAKKKLGLVPTVVSTNEDITRILLSMGFDQVFILVREQAQPSQSLQEVPVEECSEESAKKKVLDAHKVLMSLNEKNRQAFKDLVKSLECDG